ncbi:TPA: Gfo/Idh/MocA family oxidoreductase, partial [Escherichia coli]|nr:Gfo/Idh/MocA family oxidoreductase [Escherichia coli]
MRRCGVPGWGVFTNKELQGGGPLIDIGIRNDLELVAVCDSRLSQAQALAEKYGNASVWDDPQAMLLAVKPDVVSVCSPNRFHYEHTLMALEAGCHVMC